MEECIKKHMDELYKTGMTTFRDINGEYDDVVVKIESICEQWVIGNNHLVLNSIMRDSELIHVKTSFYCYVNDEIKQLCIDYYGDD